jgi:hypothetical protein
MLKKCKIVGTMLTAGLLLTVALTAARLALVVDKNYRIEPRFGRLVTNPRYLPYRHTYTTKHIDSDGYEHDDVDLALVAFQPPFRMATIIGGSRH